MFSAGSVGAQEVWLGCRTIANPTDRLLCFDAAASKALRSTTSITKADRLRDSYVEEVVTLRPPDTFTGVLLAHGANSTEAEQIIGLLGLTFRPLATLYGKKLRIGLSPAMADGKRILARVVLLGDKGTEGLIARTDRGALISVPQP